MTGWRDAVDAYLAQLAAGAGGYEPGASDPDVWALVRAPVPEGA